jgi:hypothetical protein
VIVLDDGDVEHGRYLNETAMGIRSPASFAMKRHNSIRANGLPAELVADEGHHLKFLAAEMAIAAEALDAGADILVLNRQKMLAEIVRLLD